MVGSCERITVIMCCECNVLKGTMTFRDFIVHCAKVALHEHDHMPDAEQQLCGIKKRKSQI